jgi:hypothetical protein
MKNANVKKELVVQSDLEKQKEYAQKLFDNDFGFDLVVGDAFIRGMRDIGYKNTGTAIDEIIDNSIEAGAKNILVEYQTEKGGKKPEAVAVIDDGHGMPQAMLRAAVMWGGTHRENSRKGIGRYGYGLPSASVSQGERFTVYSKIIGEEWYSITIDLKDISDGKYTKNGRIVTPSPNKASLPVWIKEAVKRNLKKDFEQGTVVVWEKLDRLSWTTISGLNGHLIPHFGTTYRNYLYATKIRVDGTLVEPIDPLFLTPGFRHFDEDGDRADALDPMQVHVKVPGKEERAVINIRFAAFPPTFYSVDKSKAPSSTNGNPRFQITNANRGIIVCRMGRQMDTVTRTPASWKHTSTITTNYDRYWAVEIDFPAELDEEFSVTTSKQRVEISERLWEILTQSGLERSISSLRKRNDSAREKLEEAADKNESVRTSEKVMTDSEKYKHAVSGQTAEEREQKGREAFEQEVSRRKEKEKKTEQQVREELALEIKKAPYKVEFEDAPSGLFYRAEQLGAQSVIYINRKHAFYSCLYASPESSLKIKSALELLIFVIAQSEVDSIGNLEKNLFYVTEKQEWSKKLEVTLRLLQNVIGFEGRDIDKDTPQEVA